MISLNILSLIHFHHGRIGSNLSPKQLLFWYSLPFVLTAIFFIYKLYRNKTRVMSWKKGRIPLSYQATEKNIAELFIVMAGSTTKRGKLLIRAKEAMVKNYIDEHFPKAHCVVDESFDHVLWNSVDLVALVSWSSTKLSDEQRLQLFEFIVAVAISDHDINDEEHELLLYVFGRFKLKHEELSAQARKAIEVEDQSYVSGQRSVDIKRSRFLSVLGLSENASDSEIKSMYRLLVKEVHPDRFPNCTEAERQQYTARFQEIQEAYEFLVTNQ